MSVSWGTGQTAAPVIETARLILRAHRLADFDDCVSLWADASVTRFIGGRPSTRDETWGRLLRYAGHWTLLGYGFWAVEERATGRYAGDVGFADGKRDIEPSMEGMPECGWALVPAMQGRGYASEAVRAVLGWGDAKWGDAPTVCIISPENLASIKVAEKCGYVETARTRFRGEATLQFRRLPSRSKAS